MNLRDDRALPQQVEARNRLNAKANELAPLLQEVLKPYIGSKVIKATPCRNWTKKVAEALDKVTPDLPSLYSYLHGYRLTYNIYDYSVYVDLDTTYRNVGEGVGYLKVEFCLCSLNGDHLSAVEPITERRTDYTVQELTEKRTKLLELEQQVSELKSELQEFSR
jgi:hypothetical protein